MVTKSSCASCSPKRQSLGPRKKTTKPSSVSSVSSVSTSWTRTRFLGKGGYGSVYLSVTNNGEEMAVKTAEMSRASTLMEEKRILDGLSCPFVVSCLGEEITTNSDTGRQYYNLMLEFCSGGSLADFMKRRGGGLRESEVKLLATDILKGLSYIHGRQIIHCDLKPDNILLVSQATWLRPNWYVAKIADFGLALEKYTVNYDEEMGWTRGTTRYMSPELVLFGGLDYGVDVWAFGCTVLEMLTGSRVWGEYKSLNRDGLMSLIGLSGQIPFIPDSISEEAEDFLKKCLVRDPEKRWTIDALLGHPFLESQQY